MTEIVILLLGGFINLINFHRRFANETEESMPFKNQGYAMAFTMGAIIWGGLMNLIYWVAT